jgi:2-C-methyl-D-erythritol 4-phosphate cytidylyltransferase/2-C-methyl-D-erythritol 2,4-cyclodiphosphate synthase
VSKPPILALIVAGGRGVRAGGEIPKQYRMLGGMPMLRRTVLAFLDHPEVDGVRVVIHPDDRELYEASVGDLPLAPVATGGETRQASVASGLAESMDDFFGGTAMIHDAARPLASRALIDRCIATIKRARAKNLQPAVVPALPVVDSLHRGDISLTEEADRTGLMRVQTPQCFDIVSFNEIHQSWSRTDRIFADDAAMWLATWREAGTPVQIEVVEGDETNFKITTGRDFESAEALLASRLSPRVGFGFDVHAFAAGEELRLGGVLVPHDKGLAGHSDADVVLHAITDAILGALGAGDIGDHFPPSDPQWRGAPSSLFLDHARALVEAAGGRIDHVDVTIICEAPRIGPYRDAMRARIAELLRLPPARTSIKATTTERLGFTGRGEGIAAQAVASVRLPEDR